MTILTSQRMNKDSCWFENIVAIMILIVMDDGYACLPIQV